jgi:hypothetical protein
MRKQSSIELSTPADISLAAINEAKRVANCDDMSSLHVTQEDWNLFMEMSDRGKHFRLKILTLFKHLPIVNKKFVSGEWEIYFDNGVTVHCEGY